MESPVPTYNCPSTALRQLSLTLNAFGGGIFFYSKSGQSMLFLAKIECDFNSYIVGRSLGRLLVHFRIKSRHSALTFGGKIICPRRILLYNSLRFGAAPGPFPYEKGA